MAIKVKTTEIQLHVVRVFYETEAKRGSFEFSKMKQKFAEDDYL